MDAAAGLALLAASAMAVLLGWAWSMPLGRAVMKATEWLLGWVARAVRIVAAFLR